MKKLNYWCLLLVISISTWGCQTLGDEPHITKEPVVVESISGIENEYQIGQYEQLNITPSINLKKGNIKEAKFEWGINGQVVSQEKVLRVKLNKLGKFDGYFKIVSEGYGKIIEFQVRVSSTSFDRGLLLLSDGVGDRAMLTFKRLDKLESPAILDVFSDINPNAHIGKEALAICWTGEGITNPNNIGDFGDLYIALSTKKPQKTYLLDSRTLQINSEIIHPEIPDFSPTHFVTPYGFQNFLWAREHVLSMIHSGKEYTYLTGEDKHFIEPYKRHQLPPKVELAPLSCCVIPPQTDYIKAYYDLKERKMIYIAGVGGYKSGKVKCNVTPMNILAIKGKRADANADQRYEPSEIMLIGYDNSNQVKIFRFTPPLPPRKNLGKTEQSDESFISQIDAQGHISSEAITTVNPTRPFLYYSDNKGNIYIMNYDSNTFENSPYITLGKEFHIKSMLFNPYNPNHLYIAAENQNEASQMKASIFIYDVSSSSKSHKLFEGHNLGGKIRQMIYKGNGLENLM